MIDFVKNNIISIALAIFLLFFIFSAQKTSEELLQKTKELEKEVKILNEQRKDLLYTIDSLSQVDDVYVEQQEKIKYITNVKIKTVDTMSVNSLQGFFSERYPKKE